MLVDELSERKKQGLYRTRKLIESAQGSIVKIKGEEYLNFSSNDYLGFANNRLLKNHMIEAIDRYGIGSGSSQLVVGHSTPHAKLETRLASFFDRDAALVLPSGYQTNLALASVLLDSNTVVIQDKLNHASLIDAAQLSKSRLVRYKHADMKHLELLLEKHKQHKLVVISDGVFSMDGDVTPLQEMVALCNAYDALLIIDDAHGIGVLGEAGGGLLECLGINQKQVPILIGTFGKSFGASGAFVAGSALYIDSFIQKARPYIYTTAMMPALAETINYALDLVRESKNLRQQLKQLIAHYKNSLLDLKLNVSRSDTQIQPFIIGDVNETMAMSNALFNSKIFAAPIRPPTVPKNTARLRISITATHTKAEITRLVTAIKKNRNETTV